MTHTPVLIVGAGPAGLTLAIELARRDVACRLIDAAPTHFPGSRGKGLQPRTLEVFDDLGVLDQVLATGSPYPPLRSYRDGAVVWEGRMAPQRDATPQTPYPNPWLLPQNLTERILRERLAELGGTVELGTELVDASQREEAVTAVLRRADGTETVTADYLVGTDGGRSTVRRLLGVGFLGETRESERTIVADLPVDGLDRDHWHFWGDSPATTVGLCPLAGTNLFQLQAALFAGEQPAGTGEAVHAVFASRSDADIRLGQPRWVSTWRANIRLVERFGQGRIYLAGDAAHVHSPAGGQGLNTSIQDSYNLGWKLAAVLTGAPGGLLDSYNAERLPVAADVLGISTELHDGGVWGDADAYRRDDPKLTQLHIGYRNSPLSVDERAVPGRLRAGDRAPDAPCQTAGGTPTRLFDVFRGPHPTLLAFGAEAAATPGIAHRYTVCPAGEQAGPSTLVDHAGHLADGYDAAPGTLMLIRPDGYLGTVTTDPARLRGRAWSAPAAVAG